MFGLNHKNAEILKKLPYNIPICNESSIEKKSFYFNFKPNLQWTATNIHFEIF